MKIYQVISYEADKETIKKVDFAETSAEAIAKAVSYHKDGVRAEAVEIVMDYETLAVKSKLVIYD